MKLKSDIRQELIQKRTALPSSNQHAFSKDIVQLINSHEIFLESQSIAFYLPFNNEVDLTPLFHNKKNFLLPVVRDGFAMNFVQYKLGDELKMNRYKIMEPTYEKPYPPEKIDVCFLPLVGFNRKGGRIGMGSGYYDRFFALNKMMPKPTVLAGVAYDFQEDTRIENDYWDIPLNYIFTNKEVIKT